MYFAYLQTSLGLLKIEGTDEYVTRIFFDSFQIKEKSNAIVWQAKQELQEYFAGKRTNFTFPIFFKGTEFQMKVWNHLRTILYGTVESYEQVAVQIHHEKALRAVGNAIHQNPLLIVIPCHRVIRKNGEVGGFYYGSELKRKLLQFEQDFFR